ncbi:esterase/lipase family protein [Nanoarchaeota archaeon]
MDMPTPQRRSYENIEISPGDLELLISQEEPDLGELSYFSRLRDGWLEGGGIDIPDFIHSLKGEARSILELAPQTLLAYTKDSFVGDGRLEYMPGNPQNPELPAIYFYPGFAANEASVPLVSALNQLGYDVYVQVSPFMQDIKKHEGIAGNSINEIRKKNNYPGIIGIGWSMGGLAIGGYLKRNPYRHGLDTFISMGTPNLGTIVAYLGFFAKSARQMMPMSDYVLELRNLEFDEETKIATVTPTNDPISTPPETSLSNSHSYNVIAGKFSHVQMMVSERSPYWLDFLIRTPAKELDKISENRPFRETIAMKFFSAVMPPSLFNYIGLSDIKAFTVGQNYNLIIAGRNDPLVKAKTNGYHNAN